MTTETQSKHTPGRKPNENSVVVYWLKSTPHKLRTAFVSEGMLWDHGLQYSPDDDEVLRWVGSEEAFAAPDLLEACKAVLPYMDHLRGGWSTHAPANIPHSTDDLADMLASAIAKAEGKA